MQKYDIKYPMITISNTPKIVIGFLLIFFFICSPFSAKVYADAAAEYGFDFMETFDDLPDWIGMKKGYIFYEGPNDVWTYYSRGGDSTAPNDHWIKNHGPENVWGGTGKSLRLQVGGGSARRGPSRFGLYFGSDHGGPDAYSSSGRSDSGYNEVYVFYMVKYPKNAFPFDPVKTYDYFDYYKFHVMATGFTSINTWEGGGEKADYGPEINSNPNLKRCQSSCGSDHYGIGFAHRWFGGQDGALRIWADKHGHINHFFENNEWFGVEFYYNLGTPGEYNAQMKIWLYDKNGNEELVLDQGNINMMPAGKNFKFNKFFFGGNKSFGGSTDPTYFVDDFVLNGSRIGPTYFSIKLGGNNSEPIRSKGSPSGTLPSGTTSAALSLTTNEQATCRYSTTPNVDYNSMTNTLSTSGGTSHSTSISGLQDGQTYIYYVRCQDSESNSNTSDYLISFNVAQVVEVDFIPPAPPQRLGFTVTKINTGDTWKYFKGYNYPGEGWNSLYFNDSGWLSGVTGIGYGDGDDATVLSDMQNNYLTIYTRKIFNLPDVSSIAGMTLTIDYDDGFVAYINEQEVARANMPSGVPDYNTESISHEAGTPITFDLTSHINSLVEGANALAIEVHNKDIGSSDLTIDPRLSILAD